MSAPALDGVTVLDLTRVLAGPYCTRLLADLGARVIKIERPADGDEMRKGVLQLEPGRADQSTYFARWNAGKRSVAVDIAHADGRAVVLDLARIADVVVENFLPGVVTKLGVDHAAVRAVKPDIVYCSISGFGQTGPMRAWPAFAHIINAVSGVMRLEQQGEPEPHLTYFQSADVLAGAHAFGAIVAALFRRQRTGEGAYLDVSMLEAVVGTEDVTFGSVLNGGEEYPGPRPGMIVHRIGDRHVAMQSVGAPDLWARLMAAMDRPDLGADPRFLTPLARREHWPELRAIVCAWLDGFKSVDDALAALTAARLPCAPMLTPKEVAQHPHLTERGAFPLVPHPARGEIRVTGSPYHLDGRPVGPHAGPPYRVGEHTREVLRDVLRYSDDRIATLLTRGAIAAP
ncbi:MAG: CoA transferase [Candidatus Rokubacteria bacterium]|nr:CoA transferase [Candidatus Rokubacteria bacterium]